jgi:hypothetical protein
MNEEKIWNYLSAKIGNDIGAAALMGNLMAESSLNPINATGNTHGLTNQQYTDAVDAHKNENFATDKVAYGLVQWRYHTRKMGLLKRAMDFEKSVGDLYLQLDYMWQELQSYRTVLNTLYTAKSIREASDIVMLKYEKPGNTGEKAKEKRAKYAQQFYDKYAGNNIVIDVSKETIRQLMKQMEIKVK